MYELLNANIKGETVQWVKYRTRERRRENVLCMKLFERVRSMLRDGQGVTSHGYLQVGVIFP